MQWCTVVSTHISYCAGILLLIRIAQRYLTMAKFVGIVASFAGLASAQFAPNMGTLDAVADNNVEEAQEENGNNGT